MNVGRSSNRFFFQAFFIILNSDPPLFLKRQCLEIKTMLLSPSYHPPYPIIGMISFDVLFKIFDHKMHKAKKSRKQCFQNS